MAITELPEGWKASAQNLQDAQELLALVRGGAVAGMNALKVLVEQYAKLRLLDDAGADMTEQMRAVQDAALDLRSIIGRQEQAVSKMVALDAVLVGLLAVELPPAPDPEVDPLI